jgi:hypothetical protein
MPRLAVRLRSWHPRGRDRRALAEPASTRGPVLNAAPAAEAAGELTGGWAPSWVVVPRPLSAPRPQPSQSRTAQRSRCRESPRPRPTPAPAPTPTRSAPPHLSLDVVTNASLDTEADAISYATSGALFASRSRCSIGRPASVTTSNFRPWRFARLDTDPTRAHEPQRSTPTPATAQPSDERRDRIL